MGLILNGNVKGESYKDKSVSAEELMDIFEVTDRMKKLGSSMRFDLDESKVRKVGSDTLHPQQEAIMCTTTGTIDGDLFELTYFKSRVSKKQGGNSYYEYKPRKIYIQGMSLGVNLKKDKELAVYMFLHQFCKSSPTRPAGARIVYDVHDSASKAEAQFKQNQAVMNIREQIMKDSVDVLILKAQGLNLGGMSNKEDFEVRMILMEYFDKMKRAGQMNKFIEQFNSPYSLFSGLIREAIQRSILVKEAKSGKFIYKWGVGTNDAGREAYSVPAGQAPLEALIQYASNNYEFFLKNIENEIIKSKNKLDVMKYAEDIRTSWNKGVIVRKEEVDSEELTKSVGDMSVLEIVEAAANLDCIECNRKDKGIYFIKGGELDGKPLMTVEDRSEWVENFSTFLELEENSKLLITLKRKVTGTVTQLKKKQTANV